MDAERAYVDPSALARLYLHQEGSREMAKWRAKNSGPLLVTHHGRTELINSICRAAFLKCLSREGMVSALAALDADFADGHLQQADILWRAALQRAGDLSRKHTPTLGTRSLDVLHVACALELRMKQFLSFDQGQRKLAAAESLKLIVV